MSLSTSDWIKLLSFVLTVCVTANSGAYFILRLVLQPVRDKLEGFRRDFDKLEVEVKNVQDWRQEDGRDHQRRVSDIVSAAMQPINKDITFLSKSLEDTVKQQRDLQHQMQKLLIRMEHITAKLGQDATS